MGLPWRFPLSITPPKLPADGDLYMTAITVITGFVAFCAAASFSSEWFDAITTGKIPTAIAFGVTVGAVAALSTRIALAFYLRDFTRQMESERSQLVLDRATLVLEQKGHGIDVQQFEELRKTVEKDKQFISDTQAAISRARVAAFAEVRARLNGVVVLETSGDALLGAYLTGKLEAPPPTGNGASQE